MQAPPRSAPDAHHPHGRRPRGQGAAGSATVPTPPRTIARTRSVSQIPRPRGVAAHTQSPWTTQMTSGLLFLPVPLRSGGWRDYGQREHWTNVQLGLPGDRRTVRRSGTPTSFRGLVPTFSPTRGQACFSLGETPHLGPESPSVREPPQAGHLPARGRGCRRRPTRLSPPLGQTFR